MRWISAELMKSCMIPREYWYCSIPEPCRRFSINSLYVNLQGNPAHSRHHLVKGILMGTLKREPQEYSRNTIEYKDPGRYSPIMLLLSS